MQEHRIRTIGRSAAVAVALAVLAAFPAVRAADLDLDVRGGVYSDAEGPFLGAGILTPITPSRAWYFNPNVEYASGDVVDVLSANADVHYDFPTSANWTVWLGGGPALIDRSFEIDSRRDDTDVGLNFIAGIGAKRGTVRPFFQAKAVASGDNEFVVMGGIRW